MKYSDRQFRILSSASQRGDHAAILPANLKGSAAKKSGRQAFERKAPTGASLSGRYADMAARRQALLIADHQGDANLDLFSFNKLRRWQRDGVPCVAIAPL